MQTSKLQILSIPMSSSITGSFDPRFAKFLEQFENDFKLADAQKTINTAVELLGEFPKEPHVQYCIARAYGKNAEWGRALSHAATALKAKPENVDYALAVGRLYLNLKLYEHAAPLLMGAVQKAPDHFRLRWALADSFADVGRGQDAIEHYQIALTLKASPIDMQLLYFNYANCLRSLSKTEEADRYYQMFGENQDFAVTALSRRCSLSRYLPDCDMAKQVEVKLSNHKLSQDDKAELLLVLGTMHENAGQYDEAYGFWSKSRSYKSKKRASHFGFERINGMKQFYSKLLLDDARPYGHSSSKPIFVIGMPRSGTTLIEQVLGAHPNCFGAGELGRMDNLEVGFRSAYSNGNHIANIVQNAKNNELWSRAEEVLNLLEKLAGPTPKYVIDKMPTHYATMGLSALYFPNAKFIHVQRHPADSFISAFQNNMNESHAYSYDQATYVEAYLAKESIMAHWLACFPDRIYDLQYERLVVKPEETIRDVLQFLNLPWDESCMQFFNKGGMIKTFSRAQARNPIYTSSVYRWKKYEKHLGPLFAALADAGFTYPEF